MVTAYSSTPDQTDHTPFITANGTTVRDGIVAANFLPFGTKLRLPKLFGEKIFTVEDRMHPRFSNTLDIWFETRAQAKQFGVKITEAEIL
ncbi:3D domain-containing protein [Candidatus Azambacteria bacterium]|nr:3D domain-containing protein [Candidatus Azambacteria bacterium]